MNNLYSQLMNKRMMNIFRSASNPNQMIADMLNNNPAAREMFMAMKNSGQSPREFFYQMAKEKGVDPNAILKQLS